MNERDLLVALVSIGLGANILYGMFINSEWYFRLRTVQSLERNLGRSKARIVLGSIGTMLILIGGHLIFTPMLTRAISANNVSSSESMDYTQENDQLSFADGR